MAHPENRNKLAFVTARRQFTYLRLPFGIANASSIFQRTMDSLLAGLNGAAARVYLDNVLVSSTDFETHLKDIEQILTRLLKAGVKISFNKCSFTKRELQYLGHIVIPEGIRSSPEKTKAVLQAQTLKNPREVKGFLSLAGFYRRFIKKFSEIAGPVLDLTKKRTIWI
uniref:Reverse transcriptase domain-containing protein n=1 Tax=Chromera velia CCMP2878 TaxID=1169474 RepID=A0A0G4G5Z9_9ALVE|eukprot:Cvel_20436.t1-p1 / transcript=Cvel_20436.t1 / gene=Cvel_20436 / organism=Chromera_velia_CCMP2878 / gene_product=Retrovirus-related Pol polyprotein from transposon, putative / transcript_product=Retrovirus-related Pol polyprotein from transposon, putative / location=Cvel_scaffold1832:5599-6099(+) / protein_length=167 / sequence_SO=supercontig / SO=protein_coding / is_pseudo=false